VLILAILVFGSGCAKSDWIDRTLVTVDVTGTLCRVGTESICLQLEQTGGTARGFIDFKGAGGLPLGLLPGHSPVEGQVTGDVLRFAQTSGPIRGELTVSGDEMSGDILFSSPLRVVLRRVDPSKIQDLAR